jgi:hypothetical protein
MKAALRPSLSALVVAVAVTLGAGALVMGAAMAADQAAKPSVSKALSKPIGEAQKLLQANKFEEGLAKLAEAEALPNRAPYDNFAIAQLRAFALGKLGRVTEALPYYQAEVDLGFLSPEESDRISRALTVLYYQAKDYPKAVEIGQKVISAGKADADTWFVVAYSQHLMKHDTEAHQVLDAYFAEAAKKGEKASENSLLLNIQLLVAAKDMGALVVGLEKMVDAYPTPDHWRDLLVTMRDNAARGQSSDNYTFNLYRLMRETGTLRESNDFLEMAQLGVQLGSPGEANDAIKRGMAASVFTKDSDLSAAKKQQQTAQNLEGTDRAGLGKFEAEAKAAKSGEGDVRLGQAYLSYDQPEKALEAIQRGIGKGSLRNADEAQLLLGVAYLRLGRKADAAAAFAATKGTDARFANLARLWGIYARS